MIRLASLALACSLAATALTATPADARRYLPAQAQVEGALIRPPEEPRRTIAPAMRARLKKVLAARRAKNVAAFRAYARRGVYPHNYVTSGELNVWRDADGHLCAAATMIWKSGARALVNQVAAEQNYVRLADVTDGPLLDWMLTSGLTQAEIVAIQMPMIGGRDLPVAPEPGSRDWRIAEDRRLRLGYEQTLRMLAANREAGLEAAIDALAARPDLIARLVR